MSMSEIKTLPAAERQGRWCGSRAEGILVGISALLFPLALWAMPPNNGTTCEWASNFCQYVGANETSDWLARRARYEFSHQHCKGCCLVLYSEEPENTDSTTDSMRK